MTRSRCTDRGPRCLAGGRRRHASSRLPALRARSVPRSIPAWRRLRRRRCLAPRQSPQRDGAAVAHQLQAPEPPVLAVRHPRRRPSTDSQPDPTPSRLDIRQSALDWPSRIPAPTAQVESSGPAEAPADERRYGEVGAIVQGSPRSASPKDSTRPRQVCRMTTCAPDKPSSRPERRAPNRRNRSRSPGSACGNAEPEATRTAGR